jgi:hypothetical protein
MVFVPNRAPTKLELIDVLLTKAATAESVTDLRQVVFDVLKIMEAEEQGPPFPFRRITPASVPTCPKCSNRTRVWPCVVCAHDPKAT